MYEEAYHTHTHISSCLVRENLETVFKILKHSEMLLRHYKYCAKTLESLVLERETGYNGCLESYFFRRTLTLSVP